MVGLNSVELGCFTGHEKIPEKLSPLWFYNHVIGLPGQFHGVPLNRNEATTAAMVTNTSVDNCISSNRFDLMQKSEICLVLSRVTVH